MSQREVKEEIVIEYEALNFEGIERRANYRVIAFREDMQCIFERKDSAALVYHIIYRWLEKKRDDILKEIEQRKKQNLPLFMPEEVEARVWIYMSYNDFVRESGQSLGYNTVIRTLDYLVKKKVIEQRENHDPRFADYEYRINKKVVRELLSELPLFPVFIPKGTKKPDATTQTGTEETDYTHMGTDPTQTGIGSTHMGTTTTQTGTGLYPNGGTSQYYTGTADSSQIPTEESSAGSDEPDAPTSFSDEERNNLLRFGHQVAGERVETGIRITDKHKAVQAYDILESNPIIHTRNPYHGLDPYPFGYRSDLPDADPINQDAWKKALQAQVKPANETPYHIASAAIRNERLDTPGRLTLPSKPVANKQAVAAGQAPIDNDPSRQSTVLEHTPGPVQASRSLLLDSEPAQADFPPAGSTASGATTAQASGDHVTGASNPTIHKPHTVPKRPATSAPILSPEEQTVIDRWFIAMNKRYPLTDSLIKAAKLLAPCNPSVEDLKTVRGFCFTSNPEWFRDKRKGAVTLLDIAKNWEGWQSSQEKPEEPAQLPKIDEPERGVSGLPKFKTTRKYNYDD